jgi:hypothetical protein
MTRIQIEADYHVVEGIIRSPGKFEGEPVYVPYFFDLMLNGMADESYEDDATGNTADYFNITPADRQEFPELEEVARVILYYRTDGFVVSDIVERDRSSEYWLKHYSTKL